MTWDKATHFYLNASQFQELAFRYPMAASVKLFLALRVELRRG